jgi:hypothetical protein
LKESTQRIREMENKTQEEASTINVSSLACIDLANSNLHRSAASLKQAWLFFFLFLNVNDYGLAFISYVTSCWLFLF